MVYNAFVAFVLARVAAVDAFSAMVLATISAPVFISAIPLKDNATVKRFCAWVAAFWTDSLSFPNKDTAAVAAANDDAIPAPNLPNPSRVFSLDIPFAASCNPISLVSA